MEVSHDRAGNGMRGNRSRGWAGRRRTGRKRRAVLAGMEHLERRDLRAADLVFIPALDVNHDGAVAPLDALLIVNQLAAPLETPLGDSNSELDVDQDGVVSTHDVDAVLTWLGAATAVGGATGTGVAIETGVAPGTGAAALDTTEISLGGNAVLDSDTVFGSGVELDGGIDYLDDFGMGGIIPDGMGIGPGVGWPCEELFDEDLFDDDLCGPPAPLPEVMISSRVADGRAGLHEVIDKLIPTDPDGYFVVSIAEPLDHDLVVQLTVDGQVAGAGAAAGFATNGIDHSLLPNSIVIPAGKTSAEILVLVNNDLLVEDSERIRVLVQPGAGYIAPTNSSVAELTIEDNDQWQWVAPNYQPPAWSIFGLTHAWDIDSVFGGMGLVDPRGWVAVKGGTALSSQGNGVSAVLDADFHGWRNLIPFWRTEINLNAGQMLDVNFDFDAKTGNIFVRPGSGVTNGAPGAEFAKNQELTAALGFNYTVDNGFTPTEHLVTVSVTAIVGVDGTMTTSVSGGVQPGGRTGTGNRDGGPTSELSGSGGLNVSFTESTNKSYSALQETMHYTLRLKVVEKDP